jgi:hypothetical protein
VLQKVIFVGPAIFLNRVAVSELARDARALAKRVTSKKYSSPQQHHRVPSFLSASPSIMNYDAMLKRQADASTPEELPERKRQRSASASSEDSDGASSIPPYDLDECLEEISFKKGPDRLHEMLIQLAKEDPDVALQIRREFHGIENPRLFNNDFSGYVEDVLSVVNEDGRNFPSGHPIFDYADALPTIRNSVRNIGQEAKSKRASWRSKRAALEALVKIDDAISRCKFGEKLRAAYYQDKAMDVAVSKIIPSILEADRAKVMKPKPGGSSLQAGLYAMSEKFLPQYIHMHSEIATLDQ